MLRQSSQKLVVVLCSLREQSHLYRLLWREVIVGKRRDHIEEKLVVVLCSWREEKLLAVLGSLRAALAKATMRVVVALRSLGEAKREKNW